MRLPAEKVKEAILHADKDVRTAAAFYFSQAFSPDPTIMPVVIQAIERYGWNDAFVAHAFLTRIVQTDETIRWFIDQLKSIRQVATEDEFRLAIYFLLALKGADPAVLKPHEAEIMKLEALEDSAKEAISERIWVNSRPPERLWADLKELCDEHDNLTDADFDHGCWLAEALRQHKDQFADQVLAIIRGDTDHWMKVFAMILSGEWGLEAVVPDLMKAVDTDDDWIFEESQNALVKIGTEAVVLHFATEWPTATWTFRMAAAITLEYIHSDLSVQTALDLSEVEEDQLIHGLLLRSVLMNFATEGIEPTRQFILNTPLDPELLEVRSALLTSCKLLDERFPEFDAWLKDSMHDREFRATWHKEHGGDIEEEEEEVEQDAEPPVTVVRKQPRIGRNDPCPCGSGRKYKHCCGNGGSPEETDILHASAMSDVPQDSQRKYPLGTVALYGPDDKRTTKIVAGAIKHEGAEPILERWMGSSVKDNPKVQRQIKEFFERHRVRSVVATDRNIGCPHEEGNDFEIGGDCPFCPFWKGKQGSNGKE